MIRFFDYIFYRIYLAYKQKDDLPGPTASIVISIIQFFTLFSLFALLRLFYDTPLPSKYYVLPLIGGIMIYNWYKYERNLNIEKFDNQWQDEEKSRKKRNGWLIVLYIILSIMFPITIGILKHNLEVM